MSKKCIKCGEILPEDASFCPHCTTVQTEKKEIKTPRETVGFKVRTPNEIFEFKE